MERVRKPPSRPGSGSTKKFGSGSGLYRRKRRKLERKKFLHDPITKFLIKIDYSRVSSPLAPCFLLVSKTRPSGRKQAGPTTSGWVNFVSSQTRMFCLCLRTCIFHHDRYVVFSVLEYFSSYCYYCWWSRLHYKEMHSCLGYMQNFLQKTKLIITLAITFSLL